MRNAMELYKKDILTLFDEAQRSNACHEINCLLLGQCYKKMHADDFWSVLLHPLHCILKVDLKEKNPFYDKLLEFLGRFCAILTPKLITDDEIVIRLFTFLFQASQNVIEGVRYRACHTINKLLSHLEDVEITEEIDNQLRDILIPRLKDSKSLIRHQAIEALYRLQDLDDPDDPVSAAVVEALTDKIAKIRELALQRVILRRDVIEIIVTRTRDVNEKVRLAAYGRLRKLVKAMHIVTRRDVLFTAINGDSTAVKSYVAKELLKCWFETYESNIIKLMKALRLDADESDIRGTVKLFEFVLNEFYFECRNLDELFQDISLSEGNLLPFHYLNWETIAFWRLLHVHIVQQRRDSLPDSVLTKLPEVVSFCHYVREYIYYKGVAIEDLNAQRQFVFNQLFLIIQTFDLSDTYSRDDVASLVEFMLRQAELEEETTETVINTLELVYPGDFSRQYHFTMEIMSDMLYPPDTENNEGGKLIATDDIPVRLKCLNIVLVVLRSNMAPHLQSQLGTIKGTVLTDMLMYDDDMVQLKAMKCYGCLCLHLKDVACEGIHLFAAPILAYGSGDECEIDKLLLCIQAVCDLLQCYGTSLLNGPRQSEDNDSDNKESLAGFNKDTSLSLLTQALLDLMNDQDFDIQMAACVALAKLISFEIIDTPQVLSSLIVKWCHPTIESDEEDDIKQHIGYFLEKIIGLRNSGRLLAGAVFPTIETLFNAPRTSPLSKADIWKIVKILLTMARASLKGKQIQSNILFSLCNQIKKNPDEKINAIYAKMLLMIDLPIEDAIRTQEMFSLIEDARENTTDSVTLKHLTKFLSKFDGILQNSIRNEENEISEPEGDDDVEEEEDEAGL